MSTAPIAIDHISQAPNPCTPISVLNVNQHPLVLEGLASLVQSHRDLHVVGQAVNAQGAIAACRWHTPDIVTLDLQLPDLPGEDAARQILLASPGTKIVAITDARGDVRLGRALAAGVHGFVLRGTEREELVETIHLIHRGRKRIPDQVAMVLAEHFGDEVLTRREVEVLGLVAKGNRNKQVAANLAIAEETVRMHMKNILGKLCANGRTHAVTIALSRGILSI